jgi:hypothetical protein
MIKEGSGAGFFWSKRKDESSHAESFNIFNAGAINLQ